MRIPPIAMALLAVAARGVLYRANNGAFVAAFSSVPRTFSTRSAPTFSAASSDGSSAAKTGRGSTLRRRRAPANSESLYSKVMDLQKKGIWSEETMLFSAVEETATTDGIIAFPQAGKRIEDCAPRMRFAPSPTGR